jgi:hypothetical protein
MRNLKRLWTADEDARLRQLLEGGTSFILVAAKFKRTVGAVKSRSKRLRPTPQSRQPQGGLVGQIVGLQIRR